MPLLCSFNDEKPNILCLCSTKDRHIHVHDGDRLCDFMCTLECSLESTSYEHFLCRGGRGVFHNTP